MILILFVLCSCCCFLIIRYFLRGEHFVWVDDFKIFSKILRNVPFNKYSMEIKDSIDITNFDILKGFDKNLTIMSSNKRAIIIIDKKIVLETGDNGLNFVVFSRTKHKLILKYIQNFDIGCCRNNIIDMVNFIDKISVNDITIVVSRGSPFKIFSNKYDKTAQLGIKSLKFLGCKTEIFRQDDNYLLVTSKLGDVYYEIISPNPIYFPYINIIKKECRINPGNIKYPDQYIIFNDKSYDVDKMTKCSMEANIRGYNKFGIVNDYCVPMSDDEYNNNFKTMRLSHNCIMEEGGDNYMTGYEMETIYSTNVLLNNREHGIIFYELFDNEGDKFILNEGTYEAIEFNRQQINSIYIPYSFFLFIIKGTDKISFYGPLKINLTNVHKKYFDSFDTIIIQKHYDGNAVICGKYNNKQICLTYGKGTHIMYPKLFFKILYVNLANGVTKLSLYGDIHSRDLVEDFTKIGSKSIYKVKYPRIVRSIVVD